MSIRVSYGTAIELGLENADIEERPTTAYLMLSGDKCRGACRFCPQSKGHVRWLSRVSWPEYDIEEVKEGLKNSDFSRICIQSPDIPGYETSLIELVDEIEEINKPISLSAPPLYRETLETLEQKVDRIGVGIDAATNSLRKEEKPAYEPMVFWDHLGNVIEIFGEQRATAHIIVGLGEDMGDIATAVARATKAGAGVSLFPFKSKDKDVDIKFYRRAQLLTALITEGDDPKTALNLISEDAEKALEMVDEKSIFQTQGCPGCNRPYYTTSPGNEHKNYPRELENRELNKIRKDILGEDP